MKEPFWGDPNNPVAEAVTTQEEHAHVLTVVLYRDSGCDPAELAADIYEAVSRRLGREARTLKPQGAMQ